MDFENFFCCLFLWCRLSICSTIAHFAQDDELRQPLLDANALGLLLELANTTSSPGVRHQRVSLNHDVSAAVSSPETREPELPEGISIPLNEAGQQVAGVATQVRQFACFAHRLTTSQLLCLARGCQGARGPGSLGRGKTGHRDAGLAASDAAVGRFARQGVASVDGAHPVGIDAQR